MNNNLIAYSNERQIPFERSSFSGGEVRLRVGCLVPKDCEIRAHIRSSDDVMALLMLTDAMRRAGAREIRLTMPYLPYARQDRVCSPGEALSLRVLCDLINAQRYSCVEVWDAHSDVALALLDRVMHRGPGDFFYKAIDPGAKTVLVAPDAGAIKKVSGLAASRLMTYVRADKSRDPATGAITGTVVHGASHIASGDFLIVDDICDGGRTFIELAKVLRPLTSGRVNLYVTHGIFSQGTGVFDGLIDRVFVANSFINELPSNFTVL